MDYALTQFTDALKKILNQLKPMLQPLSFLICIGKDKQGKSALLRQSRLTQAEFSGERPADLYYNAHGIIIDLHENWINQHNMLLQQLIKDINRCHPAFKINGILLVLDINLLYNQQSEELTRTIEAQSNLLKRFGQALDYRINTSLMLTKLDRLAGFSDFFEQEYLHEPHKALGFSLNWGMRNNQLANDYRKHFDQFIQSLEQSLLKKIHPVRSNIKRKLIRELPLQLMQLRAPLQALLNALPTHPTRVQAIYFTSAEQGGVSIDHLNHKIQKEYPILVRDQFPQATNHRAYFIEGALTTTQAFTKQQTTSTATLTFKQTTILSVAFSVLFLGIGSHYVTTRHTLDSVSRELLAYDITHINPSQQTEALLHLTHASLVIKQFSPWLGVPSSVNMLRSHLEHGAKHQLRENYAPHLLSSLEQSLNSGDKTPATLYQTLKVYLLLGEPKLGDAETIITWFQQHWKTLDMNAREHENQLSLLREILAEPRQPLALNPQIINNVRNYLNALPVDYLYYAIAKQQLSQQQQTMDFPGLTLPVRVVPEHLTKHGFKQALSKIPVISQTLQKESWVLARKDLHQLESRIIDSYCYDYALWWQNLLRKTTLKHVQTYAEAYSLSQQLTQANSITRFIEFVQAQTSADFSKKDALFNRNIAQKFTTLQLISKSSVNELLQAFQELQPFLMTLSMVQDNGQTAFSLAKAHFEHRGLNNPLSTLTSKINQFPEPIASFSTQLPEEIWFLLINDTKKYINSQWQQQVYIPYTERIAQHYPFDVKRDQEVAIADFNRFFSPNGVLASFTATYLKPFIDTSTPKWTLKNVAQYRVPIQKSMLNELMRANVITAMFFPQQRSTSQIKFSLEKMNLDPIVARLSLTIGTLSLKDSQKSQSVTEFTWPATNALLTLTALDGGQYQLEEQGPWAFFKLLQKVNVLVDEENSKQMQILFEINGNSGRYVLKTENDINPFTPGVLSEFYLKKSVVSTA